MFRFLISMREIYLYWKNQNKRDGWILKTIFYKRGIEYFYNFVSYINDNYRNMKKVICSEKAPGAIGPYSQAIEAGGMVFVSGQLPIDAATGQMAEGIEGQTRQSLENIKHILEEAGLTMGDIVKTTVFLQDMSLFAGMNGVYATYFDGAFPARSAIAVKALPKGALVDLRCRRRRSSGRQRPTGQRCRPWGWTG